MTQRFRPREPAWGTVCASGSRFAASKQQRAIQIQRRLGADVLDAAAAVGAETVEAEAIVRLIDLVHEALAQCPPLRRVDLALEHRVLDALPEVEASPRDSAQASATDRSLRIHVVSDKHQQVKIPPLRHPPLQFLRPQ
jgi:hypothetical protein